MTRNSFKWRKHTNFTCVLPCRTFCRPHSQGSDDPLTPLLLCLCLLDPRQDHLEFIRSWFCLHARPTTGRKEDINFVWSSHVDVQSICIKDWINSYELSQYLTCCLFYLQWFYWFYYFFGNTCQNIQKNEQYNAMLSWWSMMIGTSTALLFQNTSEHRRSSRLELTWPFLIDFNPSSLPATLFISRGPN